MCASIEVLIKNLGIIKYHNIKFDAWTMLQLSIENKSTLILLEGPHVLSQSNVLSFTQAINQANTELDWLLEYQQLI